MLMNLCQNVITREILFYIDISILLMGHYYERSVTSFLFSSERLCHSI